MDPVEIDALVVAYESGQNLGEVASTYGLHRRTVADHLERRGVARRVNRRKLGPAAIVTATDLYRSGESLATVGRALHVDAATVRRELVRAGIAIRPRRGWQK